VSEENRIIERLGLAPHPEGGWYRETWRAPERDGMRGTATAILFLLKGGERSHWHRVDAAEIWFWHAGAALRLTTAGKGQGERSVRLGGDPLNGEVPQHVIAPDLWQTAEADRGWALVSCVVSPAFSFDGFTLAPPDWRP
jgi:predicted cupin superfamily sugar epimerase